MRGGSEVGNPAGAARRLGTPVRFPVTRPTVTGDPRPEAWVGRPAAGLTTILQRVPTIPKLLLYA